MSDKGYNGWTNYETWLVNLWIDNDQGTQEYWLDKAKDFAECAQDSSQVRDGIWTTAEAAKFNFADFLKDRYEGDAAYFLPSDRANVFHDLLQAALGRVEWMEIAASLLDECKESA